jgi:hypothetical protein
MRNLPEELEGEKFRELYREIRRQMAQRTTDRRDIIRAHVQFHCTAIPPCGVEYERLIHGCALCREKANVLISEESK